MKSWRSIIIISATIFIFWFIKFYLKFPDAEIGIIGVVLTVASILFGFLAGFFILKFKQESLTYSSSS